MYIHSNAHAPRTQTKLLISLGIGPTRHDQQQLRLSRITNSPAQKHASAQAVWMIYSHVVGWLVLVDWRVGGGWLVMAGWLVGWCVHGVWLVGWLAVADLPLIGSRSPTCVYLCMSPNVFPGSLMNPICPSCLIQTCFKSPPRWFCVAMALIQYRSPAPHTDMNA